MKKAPIAYRPQPPGTYDPNPDWFEFTAEMSAVLLGPTKVEQDAARAAYRKLMDAPARKRKVA